jgi:hypothetical protein
MHKHPLTRLGLASLVALALILATSATSASAHSSAAAATPEAAADELAAALSSSDFNRLQPLVSPNGFNWARSGAGGLATMTPQQTVDFLRSNSGGHLNVTVRARPILPNMAGPFPGTMYITSTWGNYGNLPTQEINLVLDQVGGSWYWSGALTNAAAVATTSPATAAPTAAPASAAPARSALPSTSTATSSDTAPTFLLLAISGAIVALLIVVGRLRRHIRS